MHHSHFLGVSQGKIAFSSAASASRDPVLFGSTDEAADAVAMAIMETRITHMMHSSSCNWPEDSGRPDFNIDDFHALVGNKLRESGFQP
jgi:hypothetical protein